MIDIYPLFDSHMHIIDSRFPLQENNGYLPPQFTCAQYRERMAGYQLQGGVVVSGSFQGFDQEYLTAALAELGDNFVGVTQLPVTVSDETILRLSEQGVRAVRFNLKRGGSEDVSQLPSMAQRVFDLAGWHVELYVDSKHLPELMPVLKTLPQVSIDHIGLSHLGLPDVIALVEGGAQVKATGFSRVDFNAMDALKTLYKANPSAVMFGTDLPSTRAPTPYSDNDFIKVCECFDEQAARNIFAHNAMAFYRVGDSEYSNN